MTVVKKEQGQDDYFNQQSKLLTLSANTEAHSESNGKKGRSGNHPCI